MRFIRRIVLLLAVPVVALPAQRSPSRELNATSSVIDTIAFSRLKWRYVGPEGNRVSAVAGVAGDPNVYYAGAASGGLFKTTDGGINWAPIFDDEPVSSIGSVAVAPSNANVVWVGTGEPWIRSNVSIGWGMFKSTDAGATWSRAGLENTGRISRIVIHPTNPDVVYVASLGSTYGPQPERGVFRTMDGGKTWERVLFVNDSTGASDLVMDPNNPRILYAGLWQIEVHTWGRTSGGAGSGLWKSTDAGSTWTRLTGGGLPTKPVGKVGLGMSRANPNRLYALIETGDGVPLPNGQETDQGRLFRSDDGGTTWQLVSSDRQLAGRTPYYNRFAVAPDNADELYFASTAWTKSIDGGKTVIDPPRQEVPWNDHHDIWIDPTNGNRMIVSHDRGVAITTNRTRSWLREIQLPIAQIYHVTVDNKVPYNVYGNMQDGTSLMGPSNSKLGGGEQSPAIGVGMWRTVGGNESGWATPDTVDGNVVWSSASSSGMVGGVVTRYDLRTNVAHSVEVWPMTTLGWPAESLTYRFGWTTPLTISPHDHNKVYVGSQHVHVTTDGGKSWHVISPDLTRNDKSRQQSSGGLTPDNLGVEYAGVVFAIAESPLDRNLVWAGTNDGLVHVTRDGGKTWTNVTGNIPRLLDWGTISNVEPSRFDPAIAYLTVDGHQVDNRDPWVYKTTDYGKSWRLITGGIPHTPLSYAHVVREDPVRRGLLYLGTEGGIFVSFDDGTHWQPLQNNMPHAPVYWITIQEHFNDLVIATYGRGIWILDDISPLRTLGSRVLAQDMHLFEPRAAYRWREPEAPLNSAEVLGWGFNPPTGAAIDYWLKTVDSTKKETVSITVYDSTGALVRTIRAPATAGLSRVWWDLRTELSRQATIKSSPEYAPWFHVPSSGMSAPGYGRISMLVPPGRYTAVLDVAGRRSLPQPLLVRKDPLSGGSAAGIRANTELVRRIVADVNDAVAMINAIENVRAQLGALKITLSNDAARAATLRNVVTPADSLDGQLLRVERKLRQTRVTGRGSDFARWPQRVAEQLLYLAFSTSSSDEAPTESQRQVAAALHRELAAIRGDYDKAMQANLTAFNELLTTHALPRLVP